MNDKKITFQRWLAKKFADIRLAVTEEWVTQDQAINLVNTMILELNRTAIKNSEEACIEQACEGKSRIILMD